MAGRTTTVIAVWACAALALAGSPAPAQQPGGSATDLLTGSADKQTDSPTGDKPNPTPLVKVPDWASVHFQTTVIGQGNWPFRSPYEGPLSLRPNLNYRSTETTTLFLAGRLWDGAEVVFNPEVSGGVGVSGSAGLAGFPNGEATRVGVPQPTPYFARLYWQQTLALGTETEAVPDGPSQVAGRRPVDRLVVRIGKMAATDQFDDNEFSHDPRTEFMNWSLMYNGAWDYPANVRGYTYGGTIELNRADWSLRYGVFAEPATANGAPIDPHILRAQGQVAEVEQRYKLGDLAGNIRGLMFLNRANMGNYTLALAADPAAPDITSVRAYRIKYGFGLSWDQQVTADAGVFARFGWNDGRTESWAFTEIDRTISCGFLVKGKRWGRPADTLGIAAVVNGLSDAHRAYLAAGGVGFIIGDGRLNYAPEAILEGFYNWKFAPGLTLGLGTQGVLNPAYNADRGPVALAAVRLHAEY